MRSRAPLSTRRSKYGPRLEKHEQADTVRLIETVGGTPYVLGTRRPKGDYQGTRQTPGVADVIAFLPPKPRRSPYALADVSEAGHAWTLVMVEQKRSKGRLTPAQKRFRELCKLAQVDHVVGGVQEFAVYLRHKGILA